MGEPKWTQGEWHAFMGYLAGPELKDYPTADVLCDGRTIASVKWPVDNPEEFFANCQLLAAAPDLYRELENLVELAEAAMRTANRDGGEYDIEAELAGARAALRKARGEADGN